MTRLEDVRYIVSYHYAMRHADAATRKRMNALEHENDELRDQLIERMYAGRFRRGRKIAGVFFSSSIATIAIAFLASSFTQTTAGYCVWLGWQTVYGHSARTAQLSKQFCGADALPIVGAGFHPASAALLDAADAAPVVPHTRRKR